MRVTEMSLFVEKEKFSVNFYENTSKQQKGIVYQYVAHFREKNSSVNIFPLLVVWSKPLFKQIQIFLRFASFQTC